MLGRILHFTGHARLRMRLRGISVADVRAVLVFGQHRPTSSPPGRAPRRVASAQLRGREAEVVYTEDERRVLVVTVEWAVERREDR